MDKDREQRLKEVMAADFTLIDLNLYLNTHPEDQRAIALYCKSLKEAQILRFNFERDYGPLTPASCFACAFPWRWIEDPWPWN